MPRARSRTRSRPTGRSRARTAWIVDTTDPSTVVAGTISVVNLMTELLDALESPLWRQGLTLLRTFLDLRVNSTDASLSTEYAGGLIMADGDAVAATVVPTPLIDGDAPWLWWERRVALPASDSQQNRKIDVRAKRRMSGNDNALLYVIHNDDPTQSLEFALGARMLIRLP